MPLKYLIDEDSCSRSLRAAIRQRNTVSVTAKIDAVYVGGVIAPATGTLDPQLIQWAAENDRVIVSGDKNTLIAAHTSYVDAGNITPGLLILRSGMKTTDIVDWLELLSDQDSAFIASSTQFLPLS